MRVFRTTRFRAQHDTIASIIVELERALTRRSIERDPLGARKLLSQLQGTLTVHAAMENEALYPDLLASSDEDVRRRAARLLHDVGPVYESLARFSSSWPSADAIARDPSRFIREAHRALDVLTSRIARENDELYPLVDAAESPRH